MAAMVSERVYCTSLRELIVAGAEMLYSGEDRWLEILGAAEELKETNPELARSLREYVEEHRDECVEDGVCPHCGGEVERRTQVDRHPAPFGWGTAPETRTVYFCANCGEV